VNLSITPEHVIFIPGILLIGLTLGYLMGAKAVRRELQKKRAKMKE
jgi:hypothetical protein